MFGARFINERGRAYISHVRDWHFSCWLCITSQTTGRVQKTKLKNNMEYSHLLTILRLSLKESHLATFFFVMLSPGKLLTLPATVLHLYSTEC